jgi:hypothetical protein
VGWAFRQSFQGWRWAERKLKGGWSFAIDGDGEHVVEEGSFRKVWEGLGEVRVEGDGFVGMRVGGKKFPAEIKVCAGELGSVDKEGEYGLGAAGEDGIAEAVGGFGKAVRVVATTKGEAAEGIGEVVQAVGKSEGREQ